MGYRSEVVCVIYPYGDGGELSQKYNLLTVLMKTTFKDIADDFSSHMRWLDNDRIVEFHMESIKWYEDYDFVQRFEDMVDRFADGEFEGLVVEFMRVGEEEGDIENKMSNNCEYFLSTTTSIVRNYS